VRAPAGVTSLSSSSRSIVGFTVAYRPTWLVVGSICVISPMMSMRAEAGQSPPSSVSRTSHAGRDALGSSALYSNTPLSVPPGWA
jgi:hypothetical protein